MQPLALFFLSEAPAVVYELPDFRCLSVKDIEGAWGRSMHKVYLRALRQRETMAELMMERGEVPSSDVPARSISDNPEVVGATVREAIGLTASDQSKWARNNTLPNDLVDSVEDLGVLVLRTSDVSLRTMRGFSLSDGEIPVVVVNALDSWKGQIFTLFHEFAHLMLREGGVCDLFGPDDRRSRRIERWCNKVAGAALMPRDSLLAAVDTYQAGEREWLKSELQDLSGSYGVSWEAMLIRLVDLGRASQEFCDVTRQEYVQWRLEQREQEKDLRSKDAGGPPWVTMTIRDQGRAYVREVLNAYHSGTITLWSLIETLGIKPKHLPKLEERALNL
ncbi:MAG: ImmA/IrrE family metallo-endopeptidase [Acidimicrobiia bacterium]|nr:ImmA/IrrE family metallo-endopeptidase [Acidimicrobiia bacterium]MYC58198.1 ImmA/IrrE family metallo-endopeptidase [Acidimicrobiia bacterium]MYI30630.1 ImmA/IrrE family metallo-endopeptidase [Acidimicrobiia bacterium]